MQRIKIKRRLDDLSTKLLQKSWTSRKLIANRLSHQKKFIFFCQIACFTWAQQAGEPVSLFKIYRSFILCQDYLILNHFIGFLNKVFFNLSFILYIICFFIQKLLFTRYNYMNLTLDGLTCVSTAKNFCNMRCVNMRIEQSETKDNQHFRRYEVSDQTIGITHLHKAKCVHTAPGASFQFQFFQSISTIFYYFWFLLYFTNANV